VQLWGKPVQVFVKSLTGKIITSDADFDAPILCLKMVVLEKENIPVGRFGLAHWIQLVIGDPL
jgi:hypothetical protein